MLSPLLQEQSNVNIFVEESVASSIDKRKKAQWNYNKLSESAIKIELDDDSHSHSKSQ